MKDILLLKQCKSCGNSITLTESVNTDTQKLMLVERCLKCGAHPVIEVTELANVELQSKATAYDSKEVQDAIECNRIENVLLKKFEIKLFNNQHDGIYKVDLIGGIYGSLRRFFVGDTKLEALTKALEWVEGEKNERT